MIGSWDESDPGLLRRCPIFRFIVVSAEAIIMNLLSVGAAYGDGACGTGADLSGFQQADMNRHMDTGVHGLLRVPAMITGVALITLTVFSGLPPG